MTGIKEWGECNCRDLGLLEA